MTGAEIPTVLPSPALGSGVSSLEEVAIFFLTGLSRKGPLAIRPPPQESLSLVLHGGPCAGRGPSGMITPTRKCFSEPG